jgi:5-methylcytosine-specific restriction enzyme A
MPYKAKRPCRERGCPALVDKTSYCPAHTHKERKPWARADNAGTTKERGYGWLWQSKIRPRILKRDPFCMSGVICDSDNTGNRAPSTHCDHIVPKSRGGGDDSEENLQGLCEACHAHKTATEDSK